MPAWSSRRGTWWPGPSRTRWWPGGRPTCWLDISHCQRDHVLTHFPNIAAQCLQQGIDITADPIPVAPAAHYMCGGVQVTHGSPAAPHKVHGKHTVLDPRAQGCSSSTPIRRVASSALRRSPRTGTDHSQWSVVDQGIFIPSCVKVVRLETLTNKS